VSVKQTRLINVLYTAHNYDQFYWAHRVQQLGVGVSSSTRDDITVDCLVQALREALQPEVKTRAREVASTALYAAGQLTPPSVSADYPIPRKRGSSASRNPSPMRLKAATVNRMASPGKSDSQGWVAL
jgi:hypothetical protein